MLQVTNISKSFGGEEVLRDLSFTLQISKTLSILGRSGSGKTTLLKIISGLTSPDKGDIRWNSKQMNHIRPAKREMIYLYQESLLFPHMSVFDNMAYGLKIRNTAKSAQKKRVEVMLEKLGLENMAQKMPNQLSGGQKQRVSFGRALIVKPRLLLLDEPFGNLDVETREKMQQLFKDIAHDMGITSIFVTHNLKEAILMGDCIAHMQNGRLYTYESIDEFIYSEKTGVQDEIAFWQGLTR